MFRLEVRASHFLGRCCTTLAMLRIVVDLKIFKTISISLTRTLLQYLGYILDCQ
jgi:hypothetical protein